MYQNVFKSSLHAVINVTVSCN